MGYVFTDKPISDSEKDSFLDGKHNRRSDQKRRTMTMKGRSALLALLLCVGTFATVEAFTMPVVVTARSQQSNAQQLQQPQQLQHNHERSATELKALLDPSLLTASASDVLSPSTIHDAFSAATFFPQPFWLLISFLPKWEGTKKIMGGFGACIEDPPTTTIKVGSL